MAALGTLSLFNSKALRRGKPFKKTESLSQLEDQHQRLERESVPPQRSISSSLLEGGKGLDDGSPHTSLLQLLQHRKEVLGARQSPRASHDSILESAWAGGSDPSYSNRPSLDCQHRPGSPGAMFSPLDFDATSAPCCSARSSLDGLCRSGGASARSSMEAGCRGGPTHTCSQAAGAQVGSDAGGAALPQGTNMLLTGGGGLGGSDAGQGVPILARPPPFTCNTSGGLRPAGRSSFEGAVGVACSPDARPPSRSAELWAGATSCPTNNFMLGAEAEADDAEEETARRGRLGSPLQDSAQEEHRPQQQQQQQQQLVRPPPRLPLPRPPPAPAPAAPPPVSVALSLSAQLSSGDSSAAVLELLPLGGPASPPASAFTNPPAQAPRPCGRPGGGAGAAASTTPSVAELLEILQSGGSGGAVAAGAGARLRPISFSQPATRSPSAELPLGVAHLHHPPHDPMLDVHGTYGCHVIPEVPSDADSAASRQSLDDAMRSLSHTSRSSIDLLLSQVPPAAQRPSMELQELLGPPRLSRDSRLSLDSNSSRVSLRGGGRLVTAASALLPGTAAARVDVAAAPTLAPPGAAAPFMTPQARPQLFGRAAAAGAAGGPDGAVSSAALAELEARLGAALLPRGMQHAASTNMLAELSASEVLGASTPTAAGAAAGQAGGAYGAGAGSGLTSAFASSVVDTSCHVPSEGSPGGQGGSPRHDLWLDPDLHDTFGAHALGPPVPAAAGAAGAPSAPPSSPARRPSSSTSPRMHQPYGRDAAGLPARPTSMLDPSSVHGQHSVTVSDPHSGVPSLQFLRQRRVARERLDQDCCSGQGGYIAEAKRVLSQAMSAADPLETLLVQSSHSGAIGPLLKHLWLVKHDDAALRAGLHTLSLIISNSPNKNIIISFKGQQMLFDILCATRDLGLQEDIVRLLWDLESVSEGSTRKDCVPDLKCINSFVCLLERTADPSIASHVIHFMYGFRHIPVPGAILAETARRLVAVVAAYRYPLQDAAQYTLGLLLTAIMDDPGVSEHDVESLAASVLALLLTPRTPSQCQAVLTLLSCVASSPRARAALCACQARAKLLQFGQVVLDARLRARALSLVKVLSRQEQGPGPH